jgi:hypothetical protein
MKDLRFCYQCGFAPCLYAAPIARGEIDSCLMGARPHTAREFVWHTLYDTVGGAVTNDVFAALRRL